MNEIVVNYSADAVVLPIFTFLGAYYDFLSLN